MPAFCSHYLLFQQLEDWLKDYSKEALYPATISIGTQGPDVFFFHRAIPIFMKGKSQKAVGSELHHAKPEDIFDAFIKYLNQKDSPIAKSYIYGFIMHYALDSICHPYVFAKEKEITDSTKHVHHSSVHNQIEMSLDSYMLHKLLGFDDSTRFDAKATISCTDEEKTEIGSIVSFVVKEVLGKDVSKDEVVQAIDDMILFQRVTQEKHDLTSAVAKTLETPILPLIGYFKVSTMIRPRDWQSGIKYANLEHQKWQSPFDNSYKSDSFEDLFYKSVFEAKNLINKFDKKTKDATISISKNISFLNGLEVK